MLTSESSRMKDLRQTLKSVESTKKAAEAEVMFKGEDPTDMTCRSLGLMFTLSHDETEAKLESRKKRRWMLRAWSSVPHESWSSEKATRDVFLRDRLMGLQKKYNMSTTVRQSFDLISMLAFSPSVPVSIDTYCYVPSTAWSVSFTLLLVSNEPKAWTILAYDDLDFRIWWEYRIAHATFVHPVNQEWKDIKALCGGLVRVLELATSPELSGTTLTTYFKKFTKKFTDIASNFYKLIQYPENFTSVCQVFGYAAPIVHVTLKCLERIYNSVNETRKLNAGTSDVLSFYERRLQTIDLLLDTAFQISENILREASHHEGGAPKQDVAKTFDNKSTIQSHPAVDAESEQAERRLSQMSLYNKKDLEDLGLQEILLSPNRLRPIGSGSSSVVYERYVPNSSISYAVKEPSAVDRGTRDAIWNRVGREARIWISLKHENILPLRGFFVLPDDIPALVMDVWPNNLKRFAQASSLTEKKKLELLRDVCSALVYLHKQRIAHGDLRASNVLVKGTDQGLTAVLIDFGTAYFVDERSIPIRSAPSFEATHGQVGNPSWLSPELLRKASSGPSEESSGEQDRICISLAGDVYSFGCLCLEVLFGRDPYQSYSDEDEKKAKKLGGALPATQDETSPTFYPFLCLLWSTEPNDRPFAEGVLEEINKFLGAYTPSHVT